MRAGFSLAVLGVALVAPGAALAQSAADCPALKQVAQISMLRTRDGQSWAPVMINGQVRLFKLDTGGVTSLYPETVNDLKLPTRAGTATVVDVKGNASSELARVDSFVLGQLAFESRQNLIVLPSHNPRYANDKRAGNLSLDILKAYDIEMDFGAGQMNLFSTDHCAGRVVYWSADKVSEIPIRYDSQGKLRVTVKLDGVELEAMLDTGASTNVLNQSVGTGRLNLDLNAGDVRKMGRPDDPVYAKYFKTLELAGLFVDNPFVTIMPDKIKAQQPKRMSAGGYIRLTDTDARLPDLVIGSTILSKLHVYLASKEKKLYVTSASSGALPSGIPEARP